MLSRVRQRCVLVAFVLIGFAGCAGGKADKGAAVLASIVGDWRAPGETAVMSIHADGAYSWGKFQGRFAGLDEQRVAMSFMKNGKFAGGMPQKVALSDDTLRLTGPDGSIMIFLRVTP
jgi:hypothetical protein